MIKGIVAANKKSKTNKVSMTPLQVINLGSADFIHIQQALTTKQSLGNVFHPVNVLITSLRGTFQLVCTPSMCSATRWSFSPLCRSSVSLALVHSGAPLWTEEPVPPGACGGAAQPLLQGVLGDGIQGAHLGDVGHLGGVLRHGDGRAHAYVQVPEFHGRFPAGACRAVELLGP